MNNGVASFLWEPKIERGSEGMWLTKQKELGLSFGSVLHACLDNPHNKWSMPSAVLTGFVCLFVNSILSLSFSLSLSLFLTTDLKHWTLKQQMTSVIVV
jgi:hypothetical protein